LKVDLVRTEGQYPVPSHGGPAMMVTWSLKINEVTVIVENDRYPWKCDPRERAKCGDKPPGMMKETYDRLVETC
jgi:hypothetical protein